MDAKPLVSSHSKMHADFSMVSLYSHLIQTSQVCLIKVQIEQPCLQDLPSFPLLTVWKNVFHLCVGRAWEQGYRQKALYTVQWKTFKGENFCKLVKIRFSRRKLSQIARFCSAKGCHAPNFAEKTLAYSHKTAKFAKVFSPESFPLYGIQVC